MQDWRNSTIGMVLALKVAEAGSLPGVPYGNPSTARSHS